MRVLIVTNMYPYEGAPEHGNFVREQELALRRLDVQVDMSIHIGRRDRLNYLRGLGQMIRQLRSQRYDLIHSHHSTSTTLAVAARLATGRWKIPIIQTFHEGEVLRREGKTPGDWLRQMTHSRRLKAWALRGCRYVIATHKDMLPATLGADASAIASTVMPMGIDLERFNDGDRLEARRRLGWEPAPFYVLFPSPPGRPEKRFELARAGFEIFERNCPSARLVTGGKIPYEQMPETMRACDVVLCTSAYETGPLVVREAMACERPVVSTDVGDVRASYGDLPNLLLCEGTAEDVAAKLERAAALPQSPFGGRNRIHALGLGADEIAARVLKIYKQVLGETAD
jgi:teichuronic acid biosynthesis glycosyltransferase TuaC